MFFTHNGVRLAKSRKLSKMHPWHAAVSLKNPGEGAVFNFGPEFTYHLPGYTKPARARVRQHTIAPVVCTPALGRAIRHALADGLPPPARVQRVGSVSVCVLSMLMRQVTYRLLRGLAEVRGR